MKPYALKVIPPEDVAVWNGIKKAIDNMPDVDLGMDTSVSCHMLVRAVRKNFRNGKVRDGIYAGIHQHSWVVTGNGSVIDVYPVMSIGGVIMFDCSVSNSPGKKLFKSKPGMAKEEFQSREFLRHVRAVAKAMAQTMARLGI